MDAEGQEKEIKGKKQQEPLKKKKKVPGAVCKTGVALCRSLNIKLS